MNIFEDMDDHINKVTMMVLKSKVTELSSLMNEIDDRNYTTVSEVKTAINKNINIINTMINEKQSEQYEADAKADHITGQIPNV